MDGIGAISKPCRTLFIGGLVKVLLVHAGFTNQFYAIYALKSHKLVSTICMN